MSNSDNKQKKPVAVITGSTRGIGKEIARCLGHEGYAVVISGRNEETLNKTKTELEAEGIDVAACRANVADGKDANALVSFAVSAFGAVDVLVNNAGVVKDTLLLRMSEDDWNLVLNTNLKGAFFMCKEAVRVMLKQKRGVIVNISSVVGLMGNAGQINYSASKAGLIGLTKSLAKEYGKKGIRANAVAPGFINSDMTASLPDKVKEQMLEQIPLHVFGNPHDVANVVAFLVSDKAAYVTGQVLTVDGGLVMA